MEVNNGPSRNSDGNNTPTGSNSDGTDNTIQKAVFVNHAEITWHEIRRQWIGDRSQRSNGTPRDPIMSWTTPYEDLLSSTEPFQPPIPLAEMVDFLVDIWQDEGLYD